MRLGHFLDAGYALLVEEYQRVGMNLIEATERVDESIGVSRETTDYAPSEIATTTKNERALKELEKMMRGVK